MLNKIVAEYSKVQDTFHYDPLYVIIERNRKAIVDDTSNDYQIIGIFDTVDEAIEFNKDFRTKLNSLKEEN